MRQLKLFNRRFLMACCALMAASLFGGAALHARTRTLSGAIQIVANPAYRSRHCEGEARSNPVDFWIASLRSQ
jgi:hypothetical protein